MREGKLISLAALGNDLSRVTENYQASLGTFSARARAIALEMHRRAGRDLRERGHPALLGRESPATSARYERLFKIRYS